MAGPKDLLSEEAYDRWLKRHRLIERERQWRIRLENNPVAALPLGSRGPLPETWSAEEAFFHALGCECGSCDGTTSQNLKALRLSIRPIPPAIRSTVTRLPSVPHHLRPLLRVVVEASQSTEDWQTTPQ